MLTILTSFFFFLVLKGHGDHEDYELEVVYNKSYPNTTSVNGYSLNGLSALTMNYGVTSLTDIILYGISDATPDENKAIYMFEFSDNDFEGSSFAILNSVISLTPNFTMDSEGLAYFTDDNDDSYFFISQEGYRRFDTPTALRVYSSTGAYSHSLTLPEAFNITNSSGPYDNGGIEALDVDGSNQYIVYANEMPLMQDSCDYCVRIMIGSLSGTGSNIDQTTEIGYRYDMDGATGYIASVSEIAIIEDDELVAYVLEKYENENDDTQFFNLIYQVWLDPDEHTDEDIYSDANCWSNLGSSDCSIEAIEKELVYSFNSNQAFEDFGWTNALNFEAMTRITLENGAGTAKYLITANDNYDLVSTKFVGFDVSAAIGLRQFSSFVFIVTTLVFFMNL